MDLTHLAIKMEDPMFGINKDGYLGSNIHYFHILKTPETEAIVRGVVGCNYKPDGVMIVTQEMRIEIMEKLELMSRLKSHQHRTDAPKEQGLERTVLKVPIRKPA